MKIYLINQKNKLLKILFIISVYKKENLIYLNQCILKIIILYIFFHMLYFLIKKNSEKRGNAKRIDIFEFY